MEHLDIVSHVRTNSGDCCGRLKEGSSCSEKQKIRGESNVSAMKMKMRDDERK